MRPKPGKVELPALLIFFIILAQMPLSYDLSTYNLAAFSWLQPGTFVNYQMNDPGGGASFVLANGTLLLGLTYSYAGANLSLLVTGRTGNTVDIRLNYTIMGAATAQGRLLPTPYDLTTTIDLRIDLLTGIAYRNGRPEGIAPFFSVPVPTTNQSVSYGTAFVAGKPYNITSEVQIMDCTPGLTLGPSMESQGKTYDCVKFYNLQDDSFGTPTASYRWGWDNVSGGAHILGGPTPSWLPQDPMGVYDYYTGLVLQFSIPDYPINRTVCFIVNSSPTDCAYESFSTSLGEYFRTSGASMVLASTNAPLVPIEGSTSPLPIWLILLVGATVAIAASVLLLSRGRGKGSFGKPARTKVVAHRAPERR